MRYAQCQPGTEHALVPHEPHLELRVRIERSDQRDEAIDREERVPSALPGLGQRLGKDELDGLTVRKQPATIGRRQCRQKKVLRVVALCRHGALGYRTRLAGRSPTT